MEQINDSRISENFTTELIDMDYSIIKLSSLVPGWCTLSLIIYIIIAMLIGLPGNSLVLIVVPKVKRKTSTDWFVIFIAVCDFISLSVSGTLYILLFTPEVWTAISSEFLCKFHYYIVHFVFYQSFLLITCMGFDRYMKTCKPHSGFFTPKTGLSCCLIVTTVSLLFNISQFFTRKLNIYGECVLDSTKAAIQNSVYGFTLVVVLLCSGAVCIIYGKIAIRIRRRIKVEPSVATNTGASYTVSMNRNEAIVLSGSRGNCDTSTHQHATVSYPEVQGGISAKTVTSKYGTNDDSELAVYSNKVTNTQNKSLVRLKVKPRTSLRYQENEQQRSRATEVRQHGDHRSRQINKTSMIMGAITFVFIISTVVPTFATLILLAKEDVKRDPIARVVVFFATRLYLINNLTNPLFYTWLSSEFRRKSMETLKICKLRL